MIVKQGEKFTTAKIFKQMCVKTLFVKVTVLSPNLLLNDKIILHVHRAVAGFSSTALDVTQHGQRQGGGVASLLLARGAIGWSS